ncbi:MAG: metallophosphoesterase family protein [Candidatus Izemoplasmatales bacterium]
MKKKTFLITILILSSLAFAGLFRRDLPIVSASGGNQSAVPVTVELTSYFDPSNILSTTIAGMVYGEKISLQGDLADAPSGAVDYTFLFWELNGTILSVPLDHEFILTGENALTAVFSPSDRHVVAFVDANGKILKVEYVQDGATATPPASLPDRPGMAVTGWSEAYDHVTSDVVTHVAYETVEAGTYAVSVAGGSGDGTYAYNAVATAVADEAPSGKVFHHWERDGKVFGYGTPFSFTVFSSTALVAVYADAAPASAPRVVHQGDLGLRHDEFRKTGLARYVLPEGYAFVECGFLTHADRIAELTIDTEGAVRRVSQKRYAPTGEFLMSFAAGSASTVRAYLIAQDGEGTLVTVYDEAAYEIVNGGFEEGDLSGWTTYGIWKDESALTAFRNERVVSTAYYGSAGTNPYNKDGNYLFGVYADPYDNANKDLNQERMGMMRSSDFVLAGSGWIGFRLGGGKNDSAAYLSVHDAETDVEVARFANRHFGLTAKSGTANAEAYLFQYYADLSAYLGHTLYVLLVDAASHEWNVLSCDAVDTYLPVAPVVTADTTATNVLPVIAGAGTATNAIANGALTANLDGWGNPDGVFTIANGGAISSVGGNSAVGALRSPAFTIGVNRYLRYQFAGAVQRDKQVFVLVKEVGTNLEVLRLVRREDLAAASDSGDFKDHWYDLGGLDPAKEYYLEVVDNRDGDWGVALIRNVSLSASPDLDYRVAVNAGYGLAKVDPDDGQRRTPAAAIESEPDNGTWYLDATPAEDAGTGLNLSFQADASTAAVTYTLSSDPYFRNATTAILAGTAYSTARATVGGIDFGFSDRYLYEATLTGLSPNTTYLVRTVNGGKASPVAAFTTGDTDGTLTFLYMTDTQADTWQETLITKDLFDEAVSRYGPMAFAMVTGDVVEVGMAPLFWDRFFATGLATTPLLTVPGNHDYQDQDRATTSPSYYASLFNNPKNGVESRLDSSYYVVYGNVLFIMLDTVERTDVALQQAWFYDVVAAHAHDFLIVGTHYSMYGPTHPDEAAALRDDWLAVFDAASVDLVLSGHDHVYARTAAMAGGEATGDPLSGTVYLAGGSGGHKVYDNTASPAAFQLVPTVPTASVVTVTPTQISVTTIDRTGAVLDAFSIPVKSGE